MDTGAFKAFAACTHTTVKKLVLESEQRSASSEAVWILQIGAHLAWFNAADALGQTTRKLLRSSAAASRGQLNALLVEPQPAIYAKLKQASMSMGSHLMVENAAICPGSTASGAGQNVTFYMLDDERLASDSTTARLPRWATQVASLSREHVVRNLPKVLKSKAGHSPDWFVKAVHVQCAVLDELAQRYSITDKQLAVLTLDTEGFDARILLGSDILRKRPRIVLFEHKHSANRDLCSLLAVLFHNNYVCECDRENVFCYQHAVLEFCPGRDQARQVPSPETQRSRFAADPRRRSEAMFDPDSPLPVNRSTMDL